MEESMDGNLLIGDLEIAVEDPDIDLTTLEFRGYPCRWLYGDLEWDIEKFRTISTSTIETARQTGINKFQFDLLPVSDMYNRTFHTGADLTYTQSTRDTITYLLDSFVGSPTVTYINVLNQFINATNVTLDITENSTMAELLTLICNGIGAFYRTSQDGNLEIVIPDVDNNPAIQFNGDNIIEDSISVVESIPAYKRVTVVYGDDDRVTLETEADTGSFDEEIVIETALFNVNDATDLAYKLVEKYSRQQTVYSFDVVHLVDVVSVGDYCTLNSLLVNTTGVIQSIRRTPLTTASTIEVIV